MVRRRDFRDDGMLRIKHPSAVPARGSSHIPANIHVDMIMRSFLTALSIRFDICLAVIIFLLLKYSSVC